MGQPDANVTAGDNAFDSALAEYLRRLDGGENVDRAAFVAAHPDVAADLNAYFATAALLERIGPASDSDSHPTLSIDTARGFGSQDTVPPTTKVPVPAANRQPSSATEGEKFGRYRLLKVLGQGAMGVVHLARDVDLDREVALKVPKFTQNDAPELIERFYREARSAAAIHHRNICPLFDIGEIDGMRYITMAYIDGRPLSDYISADRSIGQRQIAGVVRKLALALAVAHERGIIHRDLKPANILIDRSKEPVIMDFGLARQINKPEDVRITQSGALVGSPAYMSPEQVESRLDEIGPQSDIYSLGVILYELLTGQLPFQGSIASVIGQIISVEPKKPSERRADVDKPLESICLKMMSKKIEARYASMQEVAEALVGYLKDPQAGADQQASLSGLNLPNKDGAKPVTGTAKVAVSSRKQATKEEYEALYRTAQKCVRAHDYEQAVGILDQIPDDRQTEEMRRLREKAQKTQDEVDLLLADIEDTRHSRIQEGLKEKVDRLLELKPGHELARQLYAKLTARSHREPAIIKMKLGPLGLFRIPAWIARTAVLAIGVLVTYGIITFFFSTKNGSVRIEIDEKFLALGNVTITFDDEKTVNIAENGQKISIEPGEHTFVVKRNDEKIDANSFMLTRGGTEVLRISTDALASKGPASTPKAPQPVATSKQAATITPPTTPAIAATVSGPKKPASQGQLTGAKEVWKVGGDEQTFGKVTFAVRFTPDGRFLANGWGVKECKLIDVASGKIDQVLPQPPGSGLIFTSDSRWLVVSARTGARQLTLFDLQTKASQTKSVEINPQLHAGGFVPGGKQLLLRGDNEKCLVVEWPDGPARQTSFAFGRKVDLHEFSPNGQLVAMSNLETGQVAVFEWATRKKVVDFQAHATHWLTSLRFSPDGNVLATSSHDGTVKFWEPTNGRLVTEFRHPDGFNNATFSPDGRYLAASLRTQGARIWDVATAQVAVDIPPQDLGMTWIEFSPDGRFVATATSEGGPKPKNPGGFGEVKLWELQYGSASPVNHVTHTPSTSATPNKDGWIDLFNGKDLTGWKTHPSQPGGNWSVQNGILVGRSLPASHLFTERGDWKDVHIRAELRTNFRANGGIFVRSPFNLERANEFPYGYEAQIYKTQPQERPNRTGTLIAHMHHREPYIVPMQNPDNGVKPDEWFTYEMIARGNHFVIKVNGKITTDYWATEPTIATGHLVLQIMGTTVAEFRKIEIRELQPGSTDDIAESPAPSTPQTDSVAAAASSLPTGGWVDLFNGKDLAGWSQDEDYWKVENGTIAAHTTPQARGPRFLVADETYGDFELTLQFKLQNEGNSGILFRSAERRGEGMKGPHVEIGYNEAKGEKVLMTGALIRLAPGGPTPLSNYDAQLRQRVSDSLRKDGWNDLSLKCQGSHVVVAVNGIQTADYRELTGPAVGFLAFQSHRGVKYRPEVAYRNIRLRRL